MPNPPKGPTHSNGLPDAGWGKPSPEHAAMTQLLAADRADRKGQRWIDKAKGIRKNGKKG